MPSRNPFVDWSIDDRSGVSTVKLASRLWGGYLSRYWLKLAIALVGMVVYAASAAAIPAGVEWINASFSGQASSIDFGDRNVAVWGPLLIIVLGAINAISQYVQARLSASAALSAQRDLQSDMFSALGSIDDAQLRALGTGQAISRFTNDVTVLRETLMRTLTAIRDLMTLIGLCAVMIWYDWALFAIVVVVYAVIGFPVSRIGKYLRTSSREAQEQTGEIASLVGENVAGGRMIRAYQMEDRERARGNAAADRRLATLMRMARLRALNEPFIFFVGSVALAIVIAAVAMRVDAGALTAPQFVSFIIALLMLSQPARGLATLNAVAQEGFGAFERILALVDAKPLIVDRQGASPLRVDCGSIDFKAVEFSYDEEVAALRGFNLSVPAGKMAALVGESGAGKSTIFNLLLRFYEPQDGVISIDGQNIAGVTLASLRQAISVVSQETLLFDDTIAANIAFGKPGASEKEIIAAAKAASADEFIRALPKGYGASVGEGGTNLSGGQRQRIAIARAFLKDAPILLLDEATSALDAESEAVVHAALSRLSKGRTTLVIAHRLSTIRMADLIVAMDKGRVIEQGGHEALLKNDGYYARVARLQFAEFTPG